MLLLPAMPERTSVCVKGRARLELISASISALQRTGHHCLNFFREYAVEKGIFAFENKSLFTMRSPHIC